MMRLVQDQGYARRDSHEPRPAAHFPREIQGCRTLFPLVTSAEFRSTSRWVAHRIHPFRKKVEEKQERMGADNERDRTGVLSTCTGLCRVRSCRGPATTSDMNRVHAGLLSMERREWTIIDAHSSSNPSSSCLWSLNAF